jgi:hypothetical protein
MIYDLLLVIYKDGVSIIHVVPIITIPIYFIVLLFDHYCCCYCYYTRMDSVLSMSCP